jgi:hypothetical protein
VVKDVAEDWVETALKFRPIFTNPIKQFRCKRLTLPRKKRIGNGGGGLHAPEDVECDGTDAGVQDVLDEDVHHVLAAHGPRAQLLE